MSALPLSHFGPGQARAGVKDRSGQSRNKAEMACRTAGASSNHHGGKGTWIKERVEKTTVPTPALTVSQFHERQAPKPMPEVAAYHVHVHVLGHVRFHHSKIFFLSFPFLPFPRPRLSVQYFFSFPLQAQGIHTLCCSVAVSTFSSQGKARQGKARRRCRVLTQDR